MNIQVAGYGIICAIGNDASAVLESLKAGRTGIGPMHYLQSVHKELPVGEVKLSNADMLRMLGQDETTIISRSILMGAIAIRQALEQAGIATEGKRVVVINGTTVGGMDVTEHFFRQMSEEDDLLPLLKKHDCGSSTRQMADLAGLADAEVCTVSTACSSAVNAIILGSEMLKAGEADIVIAGGTEALSLFHLNGFNSLMILDKEQCRPFDKSRAGLNLGEGAAYVVLKAHSEPEQGVPCPIFIRGYGNRCDAFHQTASSEDGEGAYLAMCDALQMAGLKPEDIHYINAHGTGTPNNDASESAAIRRVFGEEIPPVSSTKGFTGHTTSASGAIETVICILALRHQFLPANLGWKEQDEACIKPYVNSKLINSKFKTGICTSVLCNSFGFGGGELDGQALRQYISAGEARRMSLLMKASTLSSMQALREAGIECPDAIITATAYGMLETSEKFLTDMLEQGEETLSPTLFMQSTHNTLSSAIAIRLKCHGYNMTYSQGSDSLRWALRDAKRLIETGKARTVLVGLHDEATPTLQNIFRRMGKPVPPRLYSRSIILGRSPAND